ncbi:hypothetical protein D3C77_264920 [compost metagenome]
MDQIPKLIEIPVTIALPVSIFTHNERPQVFAVGHDIQDPILRGIHGSQDIGNIGWRIPRLILNESCLIVFLNPAVHRSMIGPVTGFISK